MKKKLSWWVLFVFGAVFITIGQYLNGILGSGATLIADICFIFGFIDLVKIALRKSKKSKA